MQPSKLYIIGNGFDLWHDIPSSYEQLKGYVKEQDRQLFDAVENYLPAGESWGDLEVALAEIDVDNIFSDLDQFMPSYSNDDWSDSGHHDFQYEVENVSERLSTGLRARFGEWIRSLIIPTPQTAVRRLKKIDPDAVFLTFNYTSTLEILYSIPRTHILHIHGDATEQDSELILGHGWNPTQRSSLNDIPDIEDIDTRLMEANDILDDYFSKTFKPSQRLIQENQDFFDQLSTVETVHVLGHSLSDVDFPYFQALLTVPGVSSAYWYIACRSEQERQSKYDLLVSFGIDARQVAAVLWNDC